VCLAGPLPLTIAAIFLLLERASATEQEMRSPLVLLTALWLLESYHSQYRSSARVVLADYCNFVS
jgi:hypothetical protein